MIHGPAIIPATQDDWVFEFRMSERRTGREYFRKVGATGRRTYEQAYRLAVAHVNPPRATAEGRTDRIIELVAVHRLHALPAQSYAVLDTMAV